MVNKSLRATPWHSVESTSIYLLFLGLVYRGTTIFDVGTCGFLNNHSFQLMGENAVMGPCPSDLPVSTQSGYMWPLCGAAEQKPVLGNLGDPFLGKNLT